MSPNDRLLTVGPQEAAAKRFDDAVQLRHNESSFKLEG